MVVEYVVFVEDWCDVVGEGDVLSECWCGEYCG